jgi:hypothetical protein
VGVGLPYIPICPAKRLLLKFMASGSTEYLR